MKIVLPWPDKRLSPNARLHWRAKAALVKKARADAHYAALEAAGYQLGTIRSELADAERIPLLVRFTPPDKRHRDEDNVLASMKGAMDGIADALHVNDRRFAASYDFAAPEKPGRVEVEIAA